MNPLLIAEVTTLCFESLARCCKQDNDARAVLVMQDEIRRYARNVAHWRLSGETKARIFLRPMETALVKHFGANVGRRLYWNFVDAFWLQSWSVTPLPQNEVEPGDDSDDGQNGISCEIQLPLSSEKDDPGEGLGFFPARCG